MHTIYAFYIHTRWKMEFEFSNSHMGEESYRHVTCHASRPSDFHFSTPSLISSTWLELEFSLSRHDVCTYIQYMLHICMYDVCICTVCTYIMYVYAHEMPLEMKVKHGQSFCWNISSLIPLSLLVKIFNFTTTTCIHCQQLHLCRDQLFQISRYNTHNMSIITGWIMLTS
jgi:hypothetical protein